MYAKSNVVSSLWNAFKELIISKLIFYGCICLLRGLGGNMRNCVLLGRSYMLVGMKSIQGFVASVFLDDRLRDTCIKESSGTRGT